MLPLSQAVFRLIILCHFVLTAALRGGCSHAPILWMWKLRLAQLARPGRVEPGLASSLFRLLSVVSLLTSPWAPHLSSVTVCPVAPLRVMPISSLLVIALKCSSFSKMGLLLPFPFLDQTPHPLCDPVWLKSRLSTIYIGSVSLSLRWRSLHRFSQHSLSCCVQVLA